ncbi:LysR family transcriptional regulator, partial [Desulfococcaceae bacterium OttesenSCG-928-F15]|nr:LysR family transcriptional regulator [Desulfococcaceae bacterium OttesenSCG-928-F15]
MHTFLQHIPYFVEVAKHKSFTVAAETINIPISTLSRKIAVMEKELGVQLLKRNTRNVELTDGGRVFYERCTAILNDAEQARKVLSEDLNNPAGSVRVAVFADLYHALMWGCFSSFALRYPAIHLQAHFSTRWVDLHTEPFDLDIRVGPLPDSGLRARKLYTVKAGFFASPKLLASHGVPKTLDDLSGMPMVAVNSFGANFELRNGSFKQKITLNPARSVHSVNSLSIAVEFALAGFGVTALPPALTARWQKSEELVPILPEWHIIGADIFAVRVGEPQPYRVRLLVEH